MLVLYAAVYLAWRPSRFEISPAELCIRFPIRRRTVPRGSIRTAEPIDSKQFRERFGRAVRVGVGGLWGGFGWLWTSKGWVEFYVSRTDAFVLLEREGMIPLLITPERPEEFARELGRKEDVAVPGG
ncbi:MAG: hypothetical protein HY319_03245 [Armatimonadetes bacterium]|nr:hypothetical protein [Armatimonadota bacterium]